MTYVLAQLAPFGALVAAFGIGGVALERVWPAASGTGALRPLARCVLGVLGWAVALFLLACVGLLGAGGVVGVAALASVVALLVRRGQAPPMSSADLGLPFLAAALAVTLPLWLLALSWQVSWDAAAYHLTLPRLYLEAGGFVPVAGNVYSNWPLQTELLYAAALAIGEHPVAKLLHGAFGLATLWAMWVGARRFHGEAAGWLAAPLLLASPVVLFEWSIAYVDLASAFFFCAGIVFVTAWRDAGRGSQACLWLAGLCGGALAGIKVNGVLGAAALFCALVGPLCGRARRGDPRGALQDALRFLAPVALLWLPWLAKSAAYTGNPVYPLLFEWFGGPDWSAHLSERLLAWQRGIGMGRDVVDHLLLPFRVTLEAGPSYDRFAGRIGPHWLLAVPLALPAWRNPLVRVALLASGAYFAFWALGSQQARFLIPMLPGLALCASVGVLEGLSWLADRRWRAAGTAMLLAVATGFALYSMRPHALAALDLLRRIAEGPAALRADAVLPVHHFVGTLPADAKLLLLNTNQGYFLARDYEADSFFEASQIADRLRGVESPAEAHARLVARGFTHVLRGPDAWDIEWPAGLERLLGDPRWAPRRFRSPDGRYEVFELVRPSPETKEAPEERRAPAGGAP